MIKTTRVGNTVVCFLENKMYQRNFDTDEELISVYETIMNTNEYEPEEIEVLIKLLTPDKTEGEVKLEKEFEEKKASAESRKDLLEWMDYIRDEGDDAFEVRGTELFMKSIPLPIPEFLGKEFVKDDSEYRSSLINFWRLLALNPNAKCREDLYGFLTKNDMTITPSGCFMAYRNVQTRVEGNKQQNEAVSREWAKVKRWKKSPSAYVLYGTQDRNDGQITKYYAILESKHLESSVGTDHKEITIPIGLEGETVSKKVYGQLNKDQDPYFGAVCIGNLEQLYQDLSSDGDETTIYTDGWTGTMSIRMGEPVSIPRNQCDSNPDATCSRGLHAANSDWLKGGYFGSTGLAILINPMNVVACPYQDSGKLRCCEYVPVSVIEFTEDGDVIPFDAETIDIEYAEHTQEQLEEMVANNKFEYLKDQNIIPMDMDFSQFSDLVTDIGRSLEEMTAIVRSRSVNV